MIFILQKLKNEINKEKYGAINYNVTVSKYYEFTDDVDASDWGNKTYQDWAKQYNKVMIRTRIDHPKACNSLAFSSIECYCGNIYRRINQFLRFDTDNEFHHYRELSTILILALNSAPKIPNNIIVYRLVCNEFIEELLANNKSPMPIPTLEKGFLSTSLIKETIVFDDEFKKYKNLLKIYVDKGATGIYVNSVTMRNEQEILIYPNYYLGLIKYPYKDKKNNKIVYECKLIYC